MHVSTPNCYVNARFTKFILNDNDLLRVASLCVFVSFLMPLSLFLFMRPLHSLYDVCGLLMQKNIVIDESNIDKCCVVSQLLFLLLYYFSMKTATKVIERALKWMMCMAFV